MTIQHIDLKSVDFFFLEKSLLYNHVDGVNSSK